MLSLYLLLLCLTPPLVLAVHACLTRLRLRPALLAPQSVALLACAVALAPAGALAWVVYLRHLPDVASVALAATYGVAVYGCLAYAYFHLFNMSETARGIHILYELRQNGQLTAEEIEEHYNAEHMLRVRLERLEALGQIASSERAYHLRQRTLYRVARPLIAWGRLLGFSMVTLEIDPPARLRRRGAGPARD
jgi:hypothetical protein